MEVTRPERLHAKKRRQRWVGLELESQPGDEISLLPRVDGRVATGAERPGSGSAGAKDPPGTGESLFGRRMGRVDNRRECRTEGIRLDQKVEGRAQTVRRWRQLHGWNSDE